MSQRLHSGTPSTSTSRRRGRRIAAGGAAISVVAVGIVAASWPIETREQPSGAADLVRSYVANCRDRVEGGYASQRAQDGVRIGPVRWPHLARNYRHLIDSGDLKPPPGTDYPFAYYPLKALAFVRAGATVTLRVPKYERRYLRLLYGDERIPVKGVAEVTLIACRRSASRTARARECQWKPYTACRKGQTQFAGGFAIDFGLAPAKGRCSDLVGKPEDKRPIRKRLFVSQDDRC